jgi:hypothetical protein
MCFGSESSTKTTNSSQTPDSRVTARSDTIMNGLMDTALPGGKARDYPVFNYARDGQLGADQVAPLNNYHNAALDTVSSAPGYEQNYGNAQGAATLDKYHGNLPVEQTAVGAYSPQSVAEFQNPWNQQVIGQGINELSRGYDHAMQDVGHSAAQAGAFGGSRQALLEGETARNFGDKMNQFVGQQEQAGFTNAQGARQNEINNNENLYKIGQDTNTANNATQQQNFGNQLTLAGQGNQLASQQANMQQGAGNLVQANDQQIRNAGNSTLQNQFTYPINLAQQLQQINTGSIAAYPISTSGTSSQPSGSGIGSSLVGAGISALFSDENIKDSIRDDVDGEKTLGAFSRMPIKSWQYDEDSQAEHGLDGDRHVGPMADDAAKAFGEEAPEAAPGVKGIDVVSMLGKMAAAIKALDARTTSLAPEKEEVD